MAQPLIDMTGERYGRLTVIGRKPNNNKQNKPLWICQCDCGNVTFTTRRRLKDGITKSCGCYRRDKAREQHTTHGLSKTSGKHKRLYRIWAGIKDRCCNPNSKYWDRYGGKGIEICDEWLNDYESFHTWSMANGYMNGLTIDRIDNSKGYTPDNCRWTTYLVQENNRTNNIKYLVDGEVVTITELCRREGLSRYMIAKKYKENMING